MKKISNEIEQRERQFSDFIEAAAHDLHAPLRKLSVLIEKVFAQQEAGFDEKSKDYMKRIQGCIDQMRSLINGLTDLAMAIPGSTQFVSCDLNLVVQQALREMDEEIRDTRSQVMVTSLPVVQGNLVQYQQLFKNLLENANKFRKKGVPLQIDIGEEMITDDDKKYLDSSPNKKYHKIEIRDNGIGFNQGYAERIFEPFVRLHSKADFEGNGLGLSICKKIVANHCGTIYAKGSENIGSSFILLLPETPIP
jgi:light-regulated signal transduction histidine kinase (bacteriophytochrome)